MIHCSRDAQHGIRQEAAQGSHVAKAFWQILGRALDDDEFIRERSRGGMNDLLNYGYAVLLSTILQKLFGMGLDPTFGISHVARERCTPLAYDLMEPFRPCVDWRVYQWVKKNGKKGLEVTKEYRAWVTGFAIEKVEYMDFNLEIQGCIEGVVRGFRRSIVENQPRYYKPWTPKNSKWAGRLSHSICRWARRSSARPRLTSATFCSMTAIR
jgi:CRISPR-associated protein Cas1